MNLPFTAQHVDLCNPVGTNGKCTWDRHTRKDPEGLCVERDQDGKITAIKAGKIPKHAKWTEKLSSIRFPGNSGIRTGAEAGIVVIDVDGDEELATYRSWNLPTTFTVKTANGYHFYFLWPEGRRLPQRLDGVLLRINGQVVGPGSVHWTGYRYTIHNNIPPVDLTAEFVDRAEAVATTPAERPARPKSSRSTSGNGLGFREGSKLLYAYVWQLREEGNTEEAIVDLVDEHKQLGAWLNDRGKDTGREVRSCLENADRRTPQPQAIDRDPMMGKPLKADRGASKDALRCLRELRQAPGHIISGRRMTDLFGNRASKVRAEIIKLRWAHLRGPACGGERQKRPGRQPVEVHLDHADESLAQFPQGARREPAAIVGPIPETDDIAAGQTPFFAQVNTASTGVANPGVTGVANPGAFDFCFSSPRRGEAPQVVNRVREAQIRSGGSGFGCMRCPGPVAYSKCPHRDPEPQEPT